LALGAAGIEEAVIHTGQHYDRGLSQVFFKELDLPEPRYRLDTRSAEPESMRPGLLRALARERPDWVLVLGDTNSTLAGARAAAELGVPVAHVEAGLRSGDLAMPEERTRIEVDRLAALLLCPEEGSARTLVAEGVTGRIEVVGDVMADASLRFAPLARARSAILADLGLEPGRYLVATVHREANVAPPRLGRIVEGLNRLREPVLLPAHPRTRAALTAQGLQLAPQVRLLDPLGYLDLSALASQARVVLTDSGGLQKEAYWYGVPCVTLRPSTEWPDTVRVGANELVDDDPDRIVAAVAGARMPQERPQLYGDGHGAERVAAALAGRAIV
ncbi:MAG: UDP-N-acetylglucosamine 2-epimerase (non-hydrolyzing), partial [Actinobacteria bacterium]|nr:UDP-N-acetylglucosamine 2-epimerase (non-hydrolyzing) [Actinomycetota bacterium]